MHQEPVTIKVTPEQRVEHLEQEIRDLRDLLELRTRLLERVLPEADNWRAIKWGLWTLAKILNSRLPAAERGAVNEPEETESPEDLRVPTMADVRAQRASGLL